MTARSWLVESEGGLEALAALRLRLRMALRQAGLEGQGSDDLLLAVSELGANALCHGDRVATLLQVELRRTGSALDVFVRDNGGCFGAASRAGSHGANFDDESGRGLRIVRALFPAAAYSGGDGAGGALNEWHLVARLPAGSGPGGSPRIALVDDDPVVLLALRGYLRDDYEVSAFESASAMLASGHGQRFDAVVSDLNMPGIDGVALRHALARESGGEATPFIFLTGSLDQSLRDEALLAGVDDFLDKPVDRAGILASLRRVLARNSSLRRSLGDRLDRRITDSLRPRIPACIHGWRSAWHCREAQAGGGDFLYVRELSGCTWLMLCDVMGHGIDAKFFAHAYSGYLNGTAEAMDADSTPAQWLRRMSRAFAGDGVLGDAVVTCIAIRVEASGELLIANAGHPAPLLACGDRIASVAAPGPLLGLNPDASYTDQRIAAGAGRLVLFTDGLLEAEGAAGERGRQRRLRELLADAADCGPDALLRRIVDAMLPDAAVLGDDVSILVLDSAPCV